MEETTKVNEYLGDDGRLFIVRVGLDGDPDSVWLNGSRIGDKETARGYAHAILELIGDPVPGKEPKGDDTYIAVVKAEYGYFLGGRIVSAISGPMYADTAIESIQEDAPPEEFHIFRRVATVGPIPQPERKVTRYE